MNKKKIIWIVVMLLLCISFIIFAIFYYKNEKSGNTMINKSEEEVIDYILNMSAYQATLNISIETNKNRTEYVVKQKIENQIAKQEVLEPSNIAGVVTEYDGANLTIKNNRLDLETTFQNYQYMVENRLWLTYFIEDYKNGEHAKSSVQGDEIILEVKKQVSPYHVHKKLYIDKKTAKPTKMIVQDINQKTLVYILYNEITIS